MKTPVRAVITLSASVWTAAQRSGVYTQMQLNESGL